MTLRVPKAEIDGGVEPIVERFGKVPAPVEATWHSPDVAMATFDLGGRASAWDGVEESLKTFAHMAVSARVGCGWCLDIGYFMAQAQDLDLEKASQVPRWRESDVFTPLERRVMDYAEAVTATPPTVTDEMTAALLEELGPRGLVELTAYIGFANLATRSNVALGVESEGFSAACEVPLAGAAR
ncbi:MAG TPA: carboxymuconolactone decarboxylase family protein [Solirubrobacterales bacterium]|nr:carboxymuconolactone decarboxylase family protein [Solirubrobacterales bacterium]